MIGTKHQCGGTWRVAPNVTEREEAEANERAPAAILRCTACGVRQVIEGANRHRHAAPPPQDVFEVTSTSNKDKENEAMEGLNQVTLIGNLGSDPDLRFGNGPDQAVCKVRIATTENYFNKSRGERQERTEWHNVTIFGKRGEALAKILRKGSPLYVQGRLQTHDYEKDGIKQYRTEVIATKVILIGSKREDASGGYDEEEEDEAPPPRAATPARGRR